MTVEKARAENRRALDALAIAVYQGLTRVSPDKLNGIRQRNAKRTAEATACLANNISKALSPSASR
jgi:hypothetical protein